MRESCGRAFDTAIEMMWHPYRRQLLVALLEHNPQAGADFDSLSIDSDIDDTEVHDLLLFHSHLPKLEKNGYIRWNQESGEISRGPNWDEIAPLLELLHNHRGKLPDGWL